MSWKFVDSSNRVVISIDNSCELELAHCIIDTVSTYYSPEVL